jgi:hypothetical protein
VKKSPDIQEFALALSLANTQNFSGDDLRTLRALNEALFKPCRIILGKLKT